VTDARDPDPRDSTEPREPLSECSCRDATDGGGREVCESCLRRSIMSRATTRPMSPDLRARLLAASAPDDTGTGGSE
jgi:hypothetical protein